NVDAHGARTDDRIHVLDTQLAHDVKLVGIVVHAQLPFLPRGHVPGRNGPLHMRGKPRVVQHLHRIELIEVDGRMVDELGVDRITHHGDVSSWREKLARTFLYWQEGCGLCRAGTLLPVRGEPRMLATLARGKSCHVG